MYDPSHSTTIFGSRPSYIHDHISLSHNSHWVITLGAWKPMYIWVYSLLPAWEVEPTLPRSRCTTLPPEDGVTADVLKAIHLIQIMDMNNKNAIIINDMNFKWHTLIIKLGAFCKQVLVTGINTITMEIVWLKKFGPKFWFSQLMRNIFQMFLSYCWICLENTFNNVSCKIVLQSIAAICLRFNVCLQWQLKSDPYN